jgi:hypothetical protein
VIELFKWMIELHPEASFLCGAGLLIAWGLMWRGIENAARRRS